MAKKATKTVKAEKATTPATSQAVKQSEMKATAPKETKKATAKTAVKKTTEKKTVKKSEEALKLEKETTKAKPSKQQAVAAKAETTVTTKTAAKETKKAPAKKAAPKAKTVKTVKDSKPKATKESKKSTTKTIKKADKKVEYYASLSLEECIHLTHTMKLSFEYEDYYQLLMEESDLAKIAKSIIKDHEVSAYTFEKDGCDQDLVLVTLTKVAETMDVKAADFKDMKKVLNKALKYNISEDGERNAAAYLDEFKLAEKLLMIGQRKDIGEASEVSKLLGADVVAFYQHFFAFAYELLPSWQYSDVKFYEDFAYAVLSQYSDLYQEEQLRIQIDVADLYIKHGDYQHGDEMYGYILRDNQIKDYIYYRYASVYKEIDFNKAKAIAYSSLQYVDDRYTYYSHIMEIINQ